MNLNRGGGFTALGSDAAHFGQRFAQRAKFPAPVLSQAPPRRSLLPTQHGKRGVSSFSPGGEGEDEGRFRTASQPNPHFWPEFAQRNLQVATNENMQPLFPRHRPRTAFNQSAIFYRAKLFALVGRVVIEHNHDLACVIVRSPVKVILMAGERWR